MINMKYIFSIFFICSLCLKIEAQSDQEYLKNSFQLNQSLWNYAGSRIHFDFSSTDVNYTRFFKNFGTGLGINRIQLVKQGLSPIKPYEEIDRRDNLHLYYLQFLLSYRFVQFCLVNNLKVSIDIAPSILIGGQNKYYASLEGGSDSLMSNSYWNNPSRPEYETKFNIYGRLCISYVFYNKYEVGINSNTYLKYIAPTLFGLSKPFSPYPSQINKSSFFSISIKYSF